MLGRASNHNCSCASMIRLPPVPALGKQSSPPQRQKLQFLTVYRRFVNFHFEKSALLSPVWGAVRGCHDTIKHFQNRTRQNALCEIIFFEQSRILICKLSSNHRRVVFFPERRQLELTCGVYISCGGL